MPVLARQLAGDDGCLAGRPVIDDLQKIAARLNIQRRHAPVVQQQHVGLGQLDQPFAEGAIAAADAQFLAQPQHALVVCERPRQHAYCASA